MQVISAREELVWHESTTVTTTPDYDTLHKWLIIGIPRTTTWQVKQGFTTTTPNNNVKIPVIRNEYHTGSAGGPTKVYIGNSELVFMVCALFSLCWVWVSKCEFLGCVVSLETGMNKK